jgi:eukaryotic-like serine/threonine-protein kinase
VPTIPWDQVREVVDAVLDLPPDERSPYLDQACPQPAVRRYVDSLILSYDQAGEFLGEPALVSHAETIAQSQADSWKGRRVGPYQIIEKIGEGGMASVYRALRVDHQYQKQVAIKVVRSGFDTRFALNRFKAERQILANLEHPNIARLLEGGSTEDGQPYFVMEYIEGQPLDQYCDDHKLTITARLRLFRMVCTAVQYAHQNLVIHRDIKPNNILVNADGVPKLLDFGIAKILSPTSTTSSAAPTITMVRLFTPEYASPEQLLDEPITTASDIYSLGVVLYELLSGQRPYRFPNRKPDEIARVVTEKEPDRPSAAVVRMEEGTHKRGKSVQPTPQTASGTREGSPEKLRRRLAGDLDNIVLMALRKEPQRRYASVELFSEDIRRHLEGLPVVARTDTFVYRSGKFVRRHTAGVAAAALVVLSLAIGLVFALREAKIAQMQRARAEHRFNDVRALANSLMFGIYDSIRNLPGSTEARKLVVTDALKYLDSLAEEARGDLSLQRELADAYERVGSVQGEPFTANLGDTAGALQSYLKAQAIRKVLVAGAMPADQIKYAANLRAVLALQLQSSDAASALRSAQEAVSATQSALKQDSMNRDLLAEMAADYADLGVVLEESRMGGESETLVEEAYRKGLEIDEKLAANSKDRNRLRSLAVAESHIGRHLRDAGYRAEAVVAFNKAALILEGLAETPNNTQAQWDLATVNSDLGDTFQMNGDSAHALANYRKALALMIAMSKADPNDSNARSGLGEANLNIGSAQVKLNNAVGARESLQRALAIFEKEAAAAPQGEGINWDLVLTYVWMASVTPESGAALAYYKKALAIDQKMGKVDTEAPEWREDESEVLVKMGDFLRKSGRLNQAAESYKQAAAISEPIVASQSARQEARYALAEAYCGLGDLAAQGAERLSVTDTRYAAKWNEARSWYERSSEAWRKIRHPGAVSPNGFDVRDPEETSRALARSNAAAVKVHQ